MLSKCTDMTIMLVTTNELLIVEYYLNRFSFYARYLWLCTWVIIFFYVFFFSLSFLSLCINIAFIAGKKK